MTFRSAIALIALLLGGMACNHHHATIVTGVQPSAQVIEKAFASSWIFGLVPPRTVATASRCLKGVAKVETSLSPVNRLMGVLTLGIYTPMNIKVTCAAS